MSFSSKPRLPHSELWLRDGVTISQKPSFSVAVDVDMTKGRTAFDIATAKGLRLTYSHLMVRAAALALAQNPEVHQMMSGNYLYRPDQVDIALSVATDAAVAPLMVIEKADAKNIAQIAREIVERTPAVREADQSFRKTLDLWGCLVPFGFLRRALLRVLFRSARFRRKGAGTFQVSLLPDIEHGTSTIFSTSGLLVVGAVRAKATVVAGEMAVRQMVTLTCCADHRVCDGRACMRFLTSLRSILESDQLLMEVAG
jgi:pyruvate dehydrogenase E2 component (dihydrolipoamide acetyltransferase)